MVVVVVLVVVVLVVVVLVVEVVVLVVEVVVQGGEQTGGVSEEMEMTVARSSAHGSSFLLHVVSLYCAFVSPAAKRAHLTFWLPTSAMRAA